MALRAREPREPVGDIENRLAVSAGQLHLRRIDSVRRNRRPGLRLLLLMLQIHRFQLLRRRRKRLNRRRRLRPCPRKKLRRQHLGELASGARELHHAGFDPKNHAASRASDLNVASRRTRVRRSGERRRRLRRGLRH